MAGRSAGRQKAIEQVTDLFRKHGYEGVSLNEVTAATGLGKSSLYHAFPGGKGDMARASLALVSRWIDDLETEVMALPTARARLDRIASGLDALYEGGTLPCLLGALSVGTGEALAAELARAMSRSMDAMRDILFEAGLAADVARMRAEDATARVQGSLILTRTLNDPAPFRRALDVIRSLADQ